MFVLLLIAFFILLSVTAFFWGADSRDGFSSCEWEHRRYHWAHDGQISDC